MGDLMADVTGAPVPSGASEFDVPGDLKALADHFGGAHMYSAVNAAALPSTGNWAGRLMLTADTGLLYAWNGQWRIVGGIGPAYQAMGAVSTAASGLTTVPFPAGRFSVAPIVTVGRIIHPNVCVSYVTNVTATGFQLATYTVTGVQVAATAQWEAKQMSPGSAVG
jgi:hypothetical protein